MADFANYSNTVQQLRDSVNQLNPTEEQITNDKKNYEQQFLVGAALAAKVKATEQALKLFKNSKTIQTIKGKSEAEIRKLIQSGQDRASELAKSLRSKITGVEPTPPPPPPLTPSANPSNVDQLKDLVDKANSRVADTKQALEDAENEMVDSRDAIRQSIENRDAAQEIVDADSRRAVTQAGGRISASQQIQDANNRKALNDARDQVESSEARAAAAEQNRNQLADQLVQHQNTADQAAKDLQRATDQAGEVEASTAGELSTGAEAVSTAAEEGEKALKIAKDVEEGSEAAAEADPFALIVTGIAAIGTQLIGRSIKAHENVFSGAKPPPTSYSATIGA